MKTGFVYDSIYLGHDAGAGHPESPMRLTRTLEHLQRQDWFKKLAPVAARRAEAEWIGQIHSADYAGRAKEACAAGLRQLDTPDVGISRDSYEAALRAAGGALELADAVMAGKIDNGFALVRPPGHHAEKNFAMGFCLFNNIAILARYLQKKHGLERILIVDWDVHHGNGTQHAFESDPSIFYVSTHQYPLYPGTGSRWETGIGRGEGATLNCPMKSGAGDEDYREAFVNEILPKAGAFRPDAVLISAGFDAHALDPLANIELTTPFFGWMTDRLLEVAAKHSKNRVISLLEGGYNLDALAGCVSTHLATLSGSEKKENPAA